MRLPRPSASSAAASLRRWNIRENGYRQGGLALTTALNRLALATPWLDLEDHQTTFETSVDCFDALIAALTAAAHLLGRTDPAPDGEVYRREGWIALPHKDFLAAFRSEPGQPDG